MFRGAALLIGLWDLFVHSVLLCALIFMFRQPQQIMNDIAPANSQYIHQPQIPFVEPPNSEQSSNTMLHNKNFLSSNILLNRILEKHNATRTPMGLNARNFYSNLDLMTIKTVASLNQSTEIPFLNYK
jgi:hypothetical protein